MIVADLSKQQAFDADPKAIQQIIDVWFIGNIFPENKVNFKFHDVIAWLTNNCNTSIAQCLEK